MIVSSVERHHLSSYIDPSKGLPGVYFHPNLLAHNNKTSDPPEFLRQLGLEVISNIPDDAFLKYTDGSRNEHPVLAVVHSPLSPKTIPVTRQEQTFLTRFRSGHHRTLTFRDGSKVFPTCVRCSASHASPEHILDCMGHSKQDVYEDPLKVLDFLRVNEIMDLV
ncbi:uncharacterized protein TNCV_3012201 [Trichonephila clavipes]|nr:uncharacterized protein TNCV_3012201 [Trichonephila clavipes]